eukprot:c56910_g1_i1 orf=130-354(+)
MPAVEYLTSPSQGSFDFDQDPLEAVTSYSRLMHLHTKAQMDSSCRSLRRKSPTSDVISAQAGLAKQNSMDSESS